MKKVILSVLAMGLTMGLMAQTKVYNGAEPMKFNANAPKTAGIVYPATFNDCASVEEPFLYTQDGQSLYLGFTGTNAFGDLAFGQRYQGANYTITGIAAVLLNASIDGTEEGMAAVVYDANGGNIGNELARVGFSTADLPDLAAEEDFELKQFTFSSPVSSSDFLCVIEVPEISISEDGSQLLGNLAFVGSTEIDCASGEMSYSYSMVSDAGDYGWGTISEAWGGTVDLDVMVFPIAEGAVGLTDAELNSMSYVYPNPAKDEVMLASSFTISRVEVINVLGQVVFASDVNANSIKVNTSAFAAGNYVAKIYTESGVATKKLVVE